MFFYQEIHTPRDEGYAESWLMIVFVFRACMLLVIFFSLTLTAAWGVNVW
jgi:hypothetical protein